MGRGKRGGVEGEESESIVLGKETIDLFVYSRSLRCLPELTFSVPK